MKKIYYYKLIRDRIPAKIRRSGGTSLTHKLTRSAFEKALLKKVGEEASALPVVRSKKELISELADVIDVIQEIKRFKKIKQSELNTARKESFRIKGGFKKRLYLIWAEDTGYHTNESTGKEPRKS